MAGSDITNRQLLDALTSQLGVITDNMVVRKDVEEIVEDKIQEAVKGLATKDELKEAVSGLATKEELKEAVSGLVTKAEFHTGLDATKNELNASIGRLERKLDSHQKANIKHHLDTRKEIGKLHGKFARMQEGLAQARGAI